MIERGLHALSDQRIMQVYPIANSSKVTTLSDLYCQDLPEGSILIPGYPVSSSRTYRDGEPVKPFYQNAGGRYTMGTANPKPPAIADRFRFSVLGDKLKVYTDCAVPVILEDHWNKALERNSYVHYGTPSGDSKCITNFPFENLSPEQHSVLPDNHYHVHSKSFISEIPCAQARTFTRYQPEFPCVIKCSHSDAGENVFMAYSKEEYDEIMLTNFPTGETVISEMILDVKFDLNCQFYLTMSGDMQWLGVSDQLLSEDKKFIGSKISQSSQPALESMLKPTLVPVAAALTHWGYFGIVGVDVLIDINGRHYVIDINPRINRSTSFQLVSPFMAGRGWDAGIFHTGKKFNGTLAQVIAAIEGVGGGKMMLFGVYENDGVLSCSVGAWSMSIDGAWDVVNQVFDS